jgi:hypothetical protein
MGITPGIFKAYDVRGLYPQEINEEAARAIGRGFVAYLGARRIAVSHDMRLSSPALAASFGEGARQQGADVVDYGLAATASYRGRSRQARGARRSPRRTIPSGIQRREDVRARPFRYRETRGSERFAQVTRGPFQRRLAKPAAARPRASWTTTSTR